MELFRKAAFLAVIFCFAAELATAVQPSLHYKYQYQARVEAAIPEINDHHISASDIRAHINVYVTDPGHIVFKIDDVEIGDFHGESDCELHLDDPLPVEYRVPQADEPGHLIGLHAFGLVGGKEFQFYEGDPLWLTNFYKSVAALLFPAVVGEVTFHTHSNLTSQSAYKIQEEHIFGLCDSTYTQYQLEGAAANEYEKWFEGHVTEDVQLDPADSTSKTGRKTTGRKTTGSGRKTRGRKTSGGVKAPPRSAAQTAALLDPTVWQVVRSVNLEDCSDTVEHQHTLTGVYCSLSRDQCKNVLSRNSHSVYYIRGDDAGMRVEQVVVKGAFLASPRGFESDMLRTRSYQMLSLETVTSLEPGCPTLDFPTLSQHHLMYTMILPYEGIGTNPKESWALLGNLRQVLEEFTAYPITDSIQAQNQERVLELFKIAVQITQATGALKEPISTPAILNYATILLYDFNEEQINSVIDAAASKLPAEANDLLFGVLAEVGSEPSIKALAKALSEGKVKPFTQALLFGSLNINLKSAKPLRVILDYLKTEDLGATPFKTSQSYVNFADLVYLLCSQDSPNTGSFALFAKMQCEKDHILPEFEDLLITQLESTQTFWKQMVLVKSLTNLRSLNALEAILPYALGKKACDGTVRLLALESLSSWKAPSRSLKDKITLILLELFENPAEDVRIRARSLGFLVSWPLSSTFWSRLAFSTHRPLLQDLAGFTYSLIESVSKFKHPEALRDALYASHALRLAKPASPGRRHSSYNTWYKYCFQSKISTLDHVEKIIDPLSPLPSAMAIYMRRVLGGTFVYSKIDMMISNDFGDLEMIFYELFQGKEFKHSDLGESGNWDRFLTMLTSGLDVKERVRDPVVGMAELIPGNEIEFFLPFEYEFLSDLSKAVAQFPKNVYYNSFEGTLATVNDIGLPVIITVAKPIAAHYDGSVYAYNAANSEYIAETSEFVGSFAVTGRVHMETMVLWSGSKVAAGFSQSLSLQLPLDITVGLKTAHFSRNTIGAQIDVTLSSKAAEGGFKAVSFEAKPYTHHRSTVMADIQDIQANSKTVHPQESVKSYTERRFDTGFGHSVSYYSDDLDTITKKRKVRDLFAFDTFDTTKSVVLSVDMDSYAKHVHARFNVSKTFLERGQYYKYVSEYGQDSFSSSEVCGASAEFQDMQQTGQTSDFYDYTQQSSNDAEFQTFQSQDFGSFGDFGSQQTAQSPEKLVEVQATDAELARPSYGIPALSSSYMKFLPSFLRKEKGWQDRIDAMSVRLALFDSVDHQKNVAYELALATTKCTKLLDKQNIKAVYVFGVSSQPCATMCAEIDITEAKFNDMDTLETLSRKDFTQTQTLKTYAGDKCQDGPFIEQNDVRKISSKAFSKIIDEITHCEDASNDPINDFARLAYYDEIQHHDNLYHDVERTCPKSVYEDLLYQAHNKLMKGLLSDTNVDLCDVWNDDIRSTEVTGQRLDDGLYLGKVITKKKDGLIQDKAFHVRYPQVFENLFAKVVSVGYSFRPADYCVINQTSLVTFDGLHSSFTLDGCPKLAVSNCEAGSHDKFAVGVMQSRDGGITVNIVARYKQLIVNMDSEGVEVNGEKLPSDAYYSEIPCETCYPKKISGHVYYRNGFRKVDVEDTLSVILKEGKVYIKIAPRYNGYVCGLCGNHDSEPVNDMKQPNGCLLTEEDKFQQAWTPQSSFSCFSSPGESADQCLKEAPLDYEAYPDHHVIY